MSTTPSQLRRPTPHRIDSTRLPRIKAHFEKYVDNGRLPGFQVVVGHGGETVYETTYGQRDIEAKAPWTSDTIFRLYSNTKIVTAVAALMLWEEGAFEMRTPLHTYIPAFKTTQVYRVGSAAAPLLDPQMEPVRMWHLFSHTAGFSYGFLHANPVDAIYRNHGFEWGVPAGMNLEAVCNKLAELPLAFQPGAEWNYSMSIDVLGRVIEVCSGMPLDEFFRTRIFEPLGMVDTAFWCPEHKHDRLAALYAPLGPGRTAARLDAMGNPSKVEPSALLGGGGLVGTAHDYHQFLQLLANGGELNGVRLLSPTTISMMASNHLPGNADLTAYGRPLFAETSFDGVGFGLGVSVTLDPIAAKAPGSAGDYGWGGAASTWAMVDPVEDLTVFFATQLLPSSTWPIRSQIRPLLYQALL
jgi:CubicO group peptidase (beta-lactamase class C family)